jgi:hypothetical protein
MSLRMLPRIAASTCSSQPSTAPSARTLEERKRKYKFIISPKKKPTANFLLEMYHFVLSRDHIVGRALRIFAFKSQLGNALKAFSQMRLHSLRLLRFSEYLEGERTDQYNHKNETKT